MRYIYRHSLTYIHTYYIHNVVLSIVSVYLILRCLSLSCLTPTRNKRTIHTEKKRSNEREKKRGEGDRINFRCTRISIHPGREKPMVSMVWYSNGSCYAFLETAPGGFRDSGFPPGHDRQTRQIDENVCAGSVNACIIIQGRRRIQGLTGRDTHIY